MKTKIWIHLFIAFIVLTSIMVSCSENEQITHRNNRKVKPGIEILIEEYLDFIKGKKVGLVTNPTGVDSHLKSSIDILYEHPDVELVALYGPEHGVRGNKQAGEYVPFYTDEKYSLPVFSLYGQWSKPASKMIRNPDEYMRSFDTVESGKIPDKKVIESLDALIFDIQDVGTRIYTYIATMSYCMQVCAENNVQFIVLDRPNPINGKTMEGPVLQYPEFSSFVGLYPIPVRHGMTTGELAQLFNDRFLEKKANLAVIPMEGWKRDMFYDDTLLPWIIPSPNMPTLNTAIVYVGQVFLEGTNISEGRGTTKPFELFGAPWIDGYELTKKLDMLNMKGVKFREAWFTPTFSKYEGEMCGGSQIHITDRNEYRPYETTLWIIKTIKKLYPDSFKFHKDYFDKISGTSRIREAIEEGVNIKDILSEYENDLKEFSDLRKPYLIY
ncbi:MAG: exo-beta-N-acetylmuramidase NamZ domain-containing protein [Candidatus Aminicenantaceae bacterium]